jgi:hypothetical protein
MRRHQSPTGLAAARLMGQASAALLPRLDGTVTEYQFASEDRRAIMLARTLTEFGIADPGRWRGSVSRYLLETLTAWIARHGSDTLGEQFSHHATLRNNPASFSSDDIDPTRLYLAVEADAAGYIVIGPTLDMLQAVHPQLPVTFYRLLIGALARWVRVYDYQDALERVEMWKEWIEGEEHPEQYELPDVEGSIPPGMRQEALKAEDLRDLISGVEDGGVRRLVEAAVALDQDSRRLNCPEISEESREALMDCNPPLPALLISFKRQDAIVGCFVTLSREFGNTRWESCGLRGCGRLTEGGRSPTVVSRPQPGPHGGTSDGYDGTYAYIYGREDVRKLASVSGSRPRRSTYGRNQRVFDRPNDLWTLGLHPPLVRDRIGALLRMAQCVWYRRQWCEPHRGRPVHRNFQQGSQGWSVCSC